MNLPNFKQLGIRDRCFVSTQLFVVFLFLFPTNVYGGSRAVTYIGNYEVTTEDSGIKKETVRVAGTMGKVIKSREKNINTRDLPGPWKYTYITTDAQGSTRQELSESAISSGTSIPKANTYYAYGTPIPSSSSSAGSITLNAQKQIVEDTYTGQKKDEETGLMYYNARYYNPQTGLFIQADSVDDGLNKYQYVASNPVNNTDPSGNRMIDHEGGGGSSPAKPSSSGLQLSGITNLTGTAPSIGTTVTMGHTTMGYNDSNPGGALEDDAMINMGLGIAGAGLAGGTIGVGIAYVAPIVAGSPAVATVIAKGAVVMGIVDTASTASACITGDTDCMLDAMTPAVPLAFLGNLKNLIPRGRSMDVILDTPPTFYKSAKTTGGGNAQNENHQRQASYLIRM
ncbi:MAG: RHS repeat-associated core domain-containing protein, partial [bacterium]|nr:RHS repeat-associated core domain-containing protein [bacterium]